MHNHLPPSFIHSFIHSPEQNKTTRHAQQPPTHSYLRHGTKATATATASSSSSSSSTTHRPSSPRVNVQMCARCGPFFGAPEATAAVHATPIKVDAASRWGMEGGEESSSLLLWSVRAMARWYAAGVVWLWGGGGGAGVWVWACGGRRHYIRYPDSGAQNLLRLGSFKHMPPRPPAPFFPLPPFLLPPNKHTHPTHTPHTKQPTTPPLYLRQLSRRPRRTVAPIPPPISPMRLSPGQRQGRDRGNGGREVLCGGACGVGHAQLQQHGGGACCFVCWGGGVTCVCVCVCVCKGERVCVCVCVFVAVAMRG
jgi:hypothetical protein